MKPPLATVRYETTSPPGLAPVANGLLVTGVSAPVEASMVNADRLFEPALATYTNFPCGSMAIATGGVPTANGLPAIALRLPSTRLMVNADTVLSPWLATYRNPAAGLMAIAAGLAPAGKGFSASALVAPVL